MATAQLMGVATSRIQVGTWTANIYVRHSYTCAQSAALIADATDRRFVLGLGVSHPSVNQALAIDKGARDLNPIFAQLHGGRMPTRTTSCCASCRIFVTTPPE